MYKLRGIYPPKIFPTIPPRPPLLPPLVCCFSDEPPPAASSYDWAFIEANQFSHGDIHYSSSGAHKTTKRRQRQSSLVEFMGQ
jgi:hypothetical protein